MKTLHIALLGLALSAAPLSGAYAHEPRVGFSVNIGYPAYVAPRVYYAPPPPVIYAPPPPLVYGPPPYVVRPYGYVDYPYRHDYGPRRGWHGHRHHHHRH